MWKYMDLACKITIIIFGLWDTFMSYIIYLLKVRILHVKIIVKIMHWRLESQAGLIFWNGGSVTFFRQLASLAGSWDYLWKMQNKCILCDFEGSRKNKRSHLNNSNLFIWLKRQKGFLYRKLLCEFISAKVRETYASSKIIIIHYRWR